MQIERTVLCFPDMDRIIVDKLEKLGKYNLEAVNGVNVEISMSVPEFRALLEKIEAEKSLLP